MDPKNKAELLGALEGLSKSTREGISTFHNVVRPIAEANEENLPLPWSEDEPEGRFSQILQRSPVSIMIPYPVADKIAAAGRMKNLFETKHGRGSTDEDQRSGWEKEMYGIDPQTEAHLRPLYGFLNPHSLHHDSVNYSGLSHPISASQYGELALDLKPEVKSRSTFINGDSSHLLTGSLVTSAGIPQLANHIFDFDPTGARRFLNGFENGEYAEFPNGYAEAQIHGGVYPEDVAAIHFNWRQPHPSTLDLTNFANHYLSFDHVMNMKPGRLEQVEAWHPTKFPTPSKNHPVGRVLAFRAAKRLANAFGVPLHVHVVDDATRKRIDTKTFLPTAAEQPSAKQPDTESVTKSLSKTFGKLQKSTREGISTFHNVVRPIAKANEARLSGPDSSDPDDNHASLFADILEASPISMMVPYSVVDKIAAAGRMKNLFETSEGRGSTHKGERAGWERDMYGIDGATPAHMRPVYGFLNPHAIHHDNRDFRGLPFPRSLSSYGEMVMDLKPHVKERSTFTNGDSADLETDSVVTHKGIRGLASHIANSVRSSTLEDFVENFHSNQAAWFPNQYAEAQIHGGVYPEDVAAIHFAWEHPSRIDPANPIHHYDVFKNVMKMTPEEFEAAEDKYPVLAISRAGSKVRGFHAAKRLANAFGVPLHVHVIDENDNRLDKKTFRPKGQKPESPQMSLPMGEPKMNPVTKSLPSQNFEDLQKSTREGIDIFHRIVKPVTQRNEKRLQDPVDYHELALAKLMEESPISMMIPYTVASKIAAAGRMKNLFETNQGRGSTDQNKRSGWEKNLFKIDPSTPAHLRPLYGFLNPHALQHDNRNFLGPMNVRGASAYGEIMIDLKPEVKARSTFINGDSINDKRSSVVSQGGLRKLASHFYKQFPYETKHFVNKFNSNVAGWFPNNYAEAQIYGGVYPEDVDAVHVQWSVPSTIEADNPMPQYESFDNVLKVPQQQMLKMVEDANTWKGPGDKIKKFYAARALANAFGVPLHVHLITGYDGPRLGKKTFLPKKTKSIEESSKVPPAMNPVTKSLLLQAFENLSKSTKAGIHTLWDYVSQLADNNEQMLDHPDPASYRYKDSMYLGDLFEKAPISIMIPYEIAHKVAKSGRFRNLFETKDGMGQTNTDVRRRLERKMFDIPDDIPGKERPVYGFLNPYAVFHDDPNFRGGIHPYGMGHYGSLSVELKPKVKDRSTFTFGDSLDYGDRKSVVRASGLRQLAQHMFARDPNAASDFAERLRNGSADADDATPRGYTEAQIHGGVYPEDVAGIHMVWEQDRVPSLKTKADAYHDFSQVARMNPSQLKDVYQHHYFRKYGDNWRGPLDHPMLKVEAFRAAKQLANKFGVPLHVHVRDSADGSKIAKRTFLPKGQKPESTQMALPFAKSEFDPKELEMGIEVELEHTDDRKKAEEIAREHLAETPDYYSKMKECGLSKGKISGLIKSMFGGR